MHFVGRGGDREAEFARKRRNLRVETGAGLVQLLETPGVRGQTDKAEHAGASRQRMRFGGERAGVRGGRAEPAEEGLASRAEHRHVGRHHFGFEKTRGSLERREIEDRRRGGRLGQGLG